MRLLPIDELNLITMPLQAPELPRTRTEGAGVDELINDVAELLVLAFYNGSMDAAEALGEEPSDVDIMIDALRESVDKKVAGKDFEQRIREHAEQGDLAAIIRVIDTDMTRVYNEAVLASTRELSKRPGVGAITKSWNTMLDDKVRDTHSYLEGVTIPLDAEFYTYDGDYAQSPGGFQNAANNVNCRCFITVSKANTLS